MSSERAIFFIMNNKNSFAVKWLLITGFILWFFFIVASFLVVHKPFSPLLIVQLGEIRWLPFGFEASRLFDTFFNLIFAGWFFFVMIGNGALVWEFVGRRGARSELAERVITLKTTPLEQHIFSAGVGFGLIGLLVLLLGLLGLLNTVALSLFAILLTVGALLGFRQMPKRLGIKIAPRSVLLYIILALFFVLTLALLPPTSWDALFYHLKGPKLYLEAGRIYGGVDIPHLNFPSLFQMNLMLAMGLRGDIAAKLLHVLFIPLLAGLLYSMSVQILGLDEGWTAVLFLLATPMILILGPTSYNDLGLSFYSVGALYAFLRWQQSEARSWLIWAGLFAGFAMSLKYTSFMTPLFIGLMLLWQVRHSWHKQLPDVLLYGGTAWLVALPWYIKNAIFTGNPFYPFVFEGLFWDEFRAAAYAESGTGLGWDIIALLRLPYDMTLAVQDASQDGLAGPLFLGFLPLVLFYLFFKVGKRPVRLMKTILLYVLANYIVWMLGVINSQALWQVRLFMPGLLALCAPMAWAYEAIREWDHPQFSLRSFMNLALGFVLSMLLITQFWGWLSTQPWAYLSGSETRAQFLTRNLGTHYAAMEAINETLPEDAVILFLWEPRSYYCNRDCRPDSILDEFGHLVYEHGTAVNIATALHDEGITHILLWRTGFEFMLENGRRDIRGNKLILDSLIQNSLSHAQIPSEVGYELYRLK